MRTANVTKDLLLEAVSDNPDKGDIVYLLLDYRARYEVHKTHHLWCTMAGEIHDLFRLWTVITKMNNERDKSNRFHINLIWDKTLARGEWWLKVNDRLRYTNRGKPLKKEKYRENIYKPRGKRCR